jgi:hypothetical protein
MCLSVPFQKLIQILSMLCSLSLVVKSSDSTDREESIRQGGRAEPTIEVSVSTWIFALCQLDSP